METQPTTAELKDIWLRAGLWRLGHSFEEDIQRPVIVQVLTIQARRLHKTHHTPVQGVLI